MVPEDTNGYVNGEYRSPLPDQLGPWTQAESIRLEVAQDVLGDMIGYCTYRKNRAKSDPAAIIHWRQEQRRFARERRDLAWMTDAQRQAVIEHYGPMVRAQGAEIRRELEASGRLDELSQP